MKISKVELQYFLQDIEEHQKVKPILLDLISKDYSYSNTIFPDPELFPSGVEDLQKTFSSDGNMMYKTDYFEVAEDSNDFTEYQEFFVKNIVYKYRTQISDYLNVCRVDEEITAESIWYHQYKKGTLHGLHNHGDCHYSSVYFLELPNGEYGTSFFNTVTLKPQIIPVKEGQMITFPAQMFHYAPTINDDTRKTVIVMNHSFINIQIERTNVKLRKRGVNYTINPRTLILDFKDDEIQEGKDII